MIELVDVSRYFDGRPAVDALSLRVDEGEFCALVGGSGCGKSTTLRLINRLLDPHRGEVLIDGQPAQQLDPQALRRRMGYVIQRVGLFPHWTVERNIALVPELLKWDADRIQARVEELMGWLGLPRRFASKYPHQLAGGQEQRVGVARALAADPDILLMDEPFAALDPIIRDELQHQLSELQARLRKTVVFVTQDMDEALRLADRLVVMNGGHVIQQGTPLQVLRRPASAFVEAMLGGPERGLKVAGLVPVEERMAPLGTLPPGDIRIHQHSSVRRALSVMLGRHTDRLTVVDDDDEPVGEVSLRRLVGKRRHD